MRRNGNIWKMRAMAWVALVPTALLPLLAGPAEAEQRKAYNKAREPHFRSELKAGRLNKLTAAQWKIVDAKRAKEAADRAANRPDARPLSAREMLAKGRGPYRNKYFAGTLPWHRSIRDVNLCNGNLFKSFTDIQVAPARGAGLAMQRTYNSQDDRIGPFGQGWTHAYDIRTEEENPDTNQTDDSLNYMDRSDFFGARHKYHRDADGLYSPPPYLFDETDSNYDKFLVGGPIKDLDDTERSMDGTVKHFTTFANSSVKERVCDSITDRYGNQTVLTYTPVTISGQIKNLLQSVTDPSGRQIVYTWSNVGTQLSPVYRITLAQGPAYSVLYAYNADCNLQSVTLDPGDTAQGHLNRTTSFGYTSYTGDQGTETGLLSSISDPLNHTISYSYGPFSDYSAGPGNVWVRRVTEPAGVDANNQPRTLLWKIAGIDTASATTPVNQPEPVQSVVGGAMAYTTDNPMASDPLNLNNAPVHNGQFVTVLFDSSLRAHATVTNTVGTLGGFCWNYDSANNVSEQQNYDYLSWFEVPPVNNLQWEHFSYGPHGNLLTHWLEGCSGVETTTYYDASQYFQKASVTDMNGRTSTFIVGTNQGVDPTNTQATSNGNKGSVLYVRDAGYGVSTNPSYQKQFAYAYNAFGQKVQETNLNGTVTQYTHGDQWGNLTQVVQDPHVTTGDSHLARTTSMVYDGAGRVLQSTDPMQQTSVFTYNALGQPTTATFPAKAGVAQVEIVTYGYGANGRAESVTDNRGTTTLAYENGCDRVHSVTDPVTGTMSYVYGITGERASMSLPGGGTWTYQYANTSDPNSCMLSDDDPNKVTRRMTGITDDQGMRVSYGVDSNGILYHVASNQSVDSNLNLVSYQATDYTFDAQGAINGSGGGAQASHHWTKRVSNTWNSKDQQGQWHSSTLVQNDYTNDLTGQRQTNQISSLDGNGNPTSRTEVYGYDEQNRLKTVNYGDGQTQSYAFDPMGNRLSKTDTGGGINGTEGYSYNAANMLTARAGNTYTNDQNGNTMTGGGRTMTWDSQNRMVSCAYNGNSTSFVYASDGLRHQSTVGGTVTDFVLDAAMFVRERRNGNNIATYLMGARGPEYRRDDTTGAVRWYLYDGLGSVLGEVDPNGNISSSRKYDVYGAVRGGNNPAGTSNHKFVGQLGHPSEDNTGLTYMQARYYDPTTGRFITQDPAEHSNNWYTYSYNNPVNFVDSDGKVPVSTAARGFFWTVGALWMTLALANLVSGGICPEAMEQVALAMLFFGLGSIGLSDTQSEILWGASAVGFVLEFVAKEAGDIASMTAESTVGLKSLAAPAVAAMLVMSVLELGFIAGIGADIP